MGSQGLDKTFPCEAEQARAMRGGCVPIIVELRHIERFRQTELEKERRTNISSHEKTIRVERTISTG